MKLFFMQQSLQAHFYFTHYTIHDGDHQTDVTEAQMCAAHLKITCPPTQKLILPYWTQRKPRLLIKFNIHHSQFKITKHA